METCYAKFKFENETNEKVNLCLLPGIARHVSTLERLGYKVDAIAEQTDRVKVSGYDGWEWLDFLKIIRAVRMDLLQLVIQNTTPDNTVFDEGIVIGRTVNSYNNTLKRIDMQPYVNVMAFDRTKITIPFEEEPLRLDAITYMALTLPPHAHIIITFVFTE
ncbi:MAG: hypothetical protein IJQ83_07500 [Bacteroidales bacterium]|nr:hypothetical protein [Bacteroidales bacterium]